MALYFGAVGQDQISEIRAGITSEGMGISTFIHPLKKQVLVEDMEPPRTLDGHLKDLLHLSFSHSVGTEIFFIIFSPARRGGPGAITRRPVRLI